MKKAVFLILVLISSTTSFCQQNNLSHFFSSAHYLKKSKIQKTTGFIFLGGGIGFVVLSAMAKEQFSPYYIIWLSWCLFMAVHSVHFFNLATVNKQKAVPLSAYLKFENAPSFQQTKIDFLSYPSFALKIDFK